jgi:hypothetical protein
VKLPNFNEENDVSKLSPDQIRSRMKEEGLLPPRPWMERPLLITATSAVFEPYVPPEGDGKLSALTLGVSIFQKCNLNNFDNFFCCTGCQAKYGISVKKEQICDGC